MQELQVTTTQTLDCAINDHELLEKYKELTNVHTPYSIYENLGARYKNITLKDDHVVDL